MLVLCYHNGALGHTVGALIDCCTKEGSQEFPSFVLNRNLHHYKSRTGLYRIRHPNINIDQERRASNTVISSTSFSKRGRLLIILMGLLKHLGNEPKFNNPVMYNQHGLSFGEQLEILSVTLKDKVLLDHDWYVNTDYQLDITSFWDNTKAVEQFLINCKLTPVPDLVMSFCNKVAETNSKYFNTIEKCVTLVQAVINNTQYKVDLTFYEAAMCHMLLLCHTGKLHTDIKLMHCLPTSSNDFIEIFKD
jgi:hypothetical protein